MRITLPSGTEAEFAERCTGRPEMGLVITPDIFGLRPLFDDMVARLASVWSMTCAPSNRSPDSISATRSTPVRGRADLDDDDHLRDLIEAADATGCDRVGLLGFCMGGMYCFKAARSDRFAKIASFYGMIRLPEAWDGAGPGRTARSSRRPATPIGCSRSSANSTPTPRPTTSWRSKQRACNVVRYPDAEHGFAHAPDRPAHRPADAADAFQRAHTWLTT